jgi:hypothetical protein
VLRCALAAPPLVSLVLDSWAPPEGVASDSGDIASVGGPSSAVVPLDDGSPEESSVLADDSVEPVPPYGEPYWLDGAEP